MTFLDFGCVKRLTPPLQAALHDLMRAGLEEDRAAATDAAVRTGLVAPDGGEPARALAGGLAHLYAPFRRGRVEPLPPAPSGQALRAALGGDLAEARRRLRVPGDLPFLNRTVIGLCAVLARLGAAADWHGIAREYLCGGPPVTALGEAERRWREGAG